MILITHRGLWTIPAEKNEPVAFRRSFERGMGTETDVRDSRGELVISHDLPKGDEITLDAMIDLMGGRDLPLAVNIKADGLAALLSRRMADRGLTRWFTFDMSVPDMVVQLRLGLPVYTRASEYESPPPCYDQAMGIWLDGFISAWYDAGTIESYLRDGKKVCVVSPELHGRDHASLWAMIKSAGLAKNSDLTLCTDIPEDAISYFGGDLD